MLPQERYDAILQLLEQNPVVKIDYLVSHFQISIETVRRDLNYLEKKGLIKKVYGGATLLEKGASEPTTSTRLSGKMDEKEAIGKKCSELIHDGDVILLEIGTTTLQVAKNIKNKKNLTVITNSIFVINELIDTSISLYIIGGRVRHEERAISGAISLSELNHFHINKAIIGAGAISLEHGISDYNIEEALIRRKIIERSRQVIIVADSSKFGYDALVDVCPLSEVDVVISDKNLSPSIVEGFKEISTNLILV